MTLPSENIDEREISDLIWKQETVLSYVLRAMVIAVVAYILLGGSFLNEQSQPYRYELLAGFSSVLFLSFYYYGMKILQLDVPEHNPFEIPPTSIGAVTALQSFFGFLAVIGFSLLLILPKEPSVITLTTIWIAGLGTWIFLLLSFRFEEMCFFYHSWKKQMSNH